MAEENGNGTRIHDDLKRLHQWMPWVAIPRGDGGKVDKKPVNPATGYGASKTKPNDWHDFDTAYGEIGKSYPDGCVAGVGLALTGDDPICAADLDGVLDPDTGEIEAWARGVVDALDSLTEFSPSGRGLRVWFRAKLPGKGGPKKTADGRTVELYDRKAFVTVTGDHLEGTPLAVEDRQNELYELFPGLADEDDALPASPVAERLTEGEREPALFSAAGTMWRRGFTVEEIIPSLLALNANRCDPPHTEKRVREIARKISERGYAPGSFPDTNATNVPGGLRPGGPLPPMPDFPIDAFPPHLSQLVARGAESVCCRPEYIGAAMLAVLGGAIGSTRTLHVHGDWYEFADPWVAVVGGPGSKKSPALKLAMKPVKERQDMFKHQHGSAKQMYEQAKGQGKKGRDLGPEPRLRSAFMSDITIEALGDELNREPRGFLVWRDELSGLFQAMDQYKPKGKGSERSDYLKMWSNSMVKVNRKSDDPIYVSDPVLTVMGGIQPDVLTDINLQGDKDDGMVHRFLFAYPDPLRVINDRGREIPSGAVLRYRLAHRKLCELAHDRGDHPRTVRFTEDGDERFWEEKRDINRQKFQPGFPSRLGYAWDKMDSQLARLSLLFAGLRWTWGDGGVEAVTGEDVDRAAKLLRYFMAATRRTHAKMWSESPEQRLLWALNGLLDEHGERWKVRTSELRRLLAGRGVYDVPERGTELTKWLQKVCENEPYLRVATGKWIDGKDRAVEIHRVVPDEGDGPYRVDDVGGVGAEETAGTAADLIQAALEDLREAFPSEIAEATGLSPKTVTNNLPALRGRSVIRYTGKTGPGGSKQVALTPAFTPEWKKPPFQWPDKNPKYAGGADGPKPPSDVGGVGAEESVGGDDDGGDAPG